jgi:hypothetical protein
MQDYKEFKMLLECSSTFKSAPFFHRSLESYWNNLVAQHYPGAELVKWGIPSRTFSRGDRIIKIQCIQLDKDPTQALQNQYQILKKIESTKSKINPSYIEFEQFWSALEMDVYPGILLSPELISENPWSIQIWRIINKLIWFSSKGMFYKQLRPRHIIWDKNLKLLNLIDFGGSELTPRSIAFVRNFSPLRVQGGSCRTEARLFGLIIRILIERIKFLTPISLRLPFDNHYYINAESKFRSKISQSRAVNSSLSESSPQEKNSPTFGYSQSAPALLEQNLVDNIHPIPTIEIGNYCYKFIGDFDWNTIWSRILDDNDFSRSTIIDLDTRTGLGFFSCNLLNVGKKRVIYGHAEAKSDSSFARWGAFLCESCGLGAPKQALYDSDSFPCDFIGLALNTLLSTDPQVIRQITRLPISYLIVHDFFINDTLKNRIPHHSTIKTIWSPAKGTSLIRITNPN